MKRFLIALAVFSLVQGSAALARDRGDGGGNENGRDGGGWGNTDNSRPDQGNQGDQGGRMDNGGSRDNQTYSRQDGNSDTQPANVRGRNRRSPESSGQNSPRDRSFNNSIRGGAHTGGTVRAGSLNRGTNRVEPNGVIGNRERAAVSPRLRAMGITRVPSLITNRSRILRTDRARSTIHLPSEGPGGRAFTAKVIGPRAISGGLVRTHMNTITANAAFRGRVNIYDRSERAANHYYWHHWNGLDFCHYYDPWGYHWYGWYLGPQFFWTRYYDDNWWWYDDTFDRWCYWNDGGWWWQDPRLNVVYVYHDGAYTPADQSASGAGNGGAETVYQSNDGTRRVKVMGGGDAFLYDTSNSPSFNPVYLASGVKDVKFSNNSDGKPLQIMLTLNDGTFQMFDANGNPYNAASAGDGQEQ